MRSSAVAPCKDRLEEGLVRSTLRLPTVLLRRVEGLPNSILVAVWVNTAKHPLITGQRTRPTICGH
jgi:hypothetical protein